MLPPAGLVTGAACAGTLGLCALIQMRRARVCAVCYLHPLPRSACLTRVGIMQIPGAASASLAVSPTRGCQADNTQGVTGGGAGTVARHTNRAQGHAQGQHALNLLTSQL